MRARARRAGEKESESTSEREKHRERESTRAREREKRGGVWGWERGEEVRDLGIGDEQECVGDLDVDQLGEEGAQLVLSKGPEICMSCK